MTETTTNATKELVTAQIVALMDSYSFETNGDSPENIIKQWQETFDLQWIHLATIEALYQGRYKAISIEQIMEVWTRMGRANTHFGGDFERVISRKLPRHLTLIENQPNRELAHSGVGIQQNQVQSDLLLATRTISPPFAQTSELDSLAANNQEISPGQDTLLVAAETKEPDYCGKISIFQPLPDASSFFFKLKAFATSQSKSS